MWDVSDLKRFYHIFYVDNDCCTVIIKTVFYFTFKYLKIYCIIALKEI